MSNHVSKRKFRNSYNITVDTAVEFLIGLDHPRALTILLLIKYQEWEQIARMEINPSHYLTADDFDRAYTASNLLRKANFIDTQLDLQAQALASFWEGEAMCEATNRRLVRDQWDVQMPSFYAEIHSAARLISKVLGTIDPNSLLKGMGFGPGVSSSCKGAKVGAYFKSISDLEVTAGCSELGRICLNASLPLPSAFLNADGPCSLLDSSMKRIKGNSVTFVPKDAKTHRAIAIEPHVNIFVQKGVGAYIRRRLSSFGVHLRNQDINGQLARLSSKNGKFATVDLSMASDTLSIELVRLLLPPPWFDLLDRIRSKWGKVGDSEWHLYSKFSSMGNGFTFELESLIFFALATVSSNEPVSVYGDDIIISSKDYLPFLELMSYVGFKVNTTKTYSNGNFRESCGKHYFNGTWVTPIYIKELKKEQDQRIYLHNMIYSWCERRYGDFTPSVFSRILKKLRASSRLLVPPILGDAGFSVSKPIPRLHPRHRHFDGWTVKALVERPVTVACKQYYAALYNSWITLTDESPSQGLTPLRGRSHRNVRNVLVSEWVFLKASACERFAERFAKSFFL